MQFIVKLSLQNCLLKTIITYFVKNISFIISLIFTTILLKRNMSFYKSYEYNYKLYHKSHLYQIFNYIIFAKANVISFI